MGLITKASNGNGVAAAARINDIRAVGNNVISVDNTGNFPGIGVGGALSGEKFHFATWAVDGSDKYVVESMMEMVGHLSSIGEITIDSFDPGYEDKGNNNGDVVRIKPTTGWENDLVDALKQSLKNDGTLKENIVGDDQLKTDSASSKILSDLGGYIVSGAEVTRTSGSSYAMSAGEIILNGKKIAVDAIQSRTFTDKKDVAIDINAEGDISYVEADRGKLPAVEGGKFRLWSAAIDTANSSGFIWSNKGQSKVVGKDNIDFATFPIQYGGGGLSAGANTRTFTPSSTGLLQVTAQGRRNSGSSGDLVLTISATGVSGPKTSSGVGSGSSDGFASTVYLATVTAGVSVTITITADGGALANAGYMFWAIPGATAVV